MGTRRTRRVGNLIRTELADLLLRRVKDPRLKLVNLTGVDVSPDLRQAKVFYSVLHQEQRAQAEQGLASALPFLQRELGARLQLKVVPRLVPVFDQSLTQGERMDRLIEQARRRDQELARERGEAEEA